MKNLLRNIKARYKRIESDNPSKELTKLVQSLTSSSPKTAFNKANRGIDAFRREKRLGLKIQKALSLGVKKPSKYQRTLDKQIKKAENLVRRTNRYIDAQRAYNKTLKLSQQRQRMNLLPLTDKQIKEAYKILNSAKKGVAKDTEKLMIKRPRKDRNKPLIELSRQYFENNYAEYIYYRTSIEQAEHSSFPQMAQLFREGGINIVEDLRKNGFTLFEYANSLTDSESSEDIIIARLMIAYRGLSARNKTLVDNFLSKNI